MKISSRLRIPVIDLANDTFGNRVHITQHEYRCESYRFNEAIQIIHFKCVWIHVIEMLELFQKALVVHRPTLEDIEKLVFNMFLYCAVVPGCKTNCDAKGLMNETRVQHCISVYL